MSGSDWFMLAFDRSMKRHNGQGNVCHLMLELSDRLDVARLQARLDESEAWRWLCALRAHRGGWFGTPAWVVSNEAPSPVKVVAVDDISAVDDALFDHARDPYTMPCVAVGVAHLASGTSVVVLSWHHALMDARGAELWALWVASEEATPPTWVVA